MRIKYLYFLVFAGIVLTVAGASKDRAGNVPYNEYQIKAAFLYNFIKFTDWPANKVAEPNTIILGLLGEHKFKDMFDVVKNKPVKNQKFIVRSFGKFSQYIRNGENGLKLTQEAEQLKKCHILFVCDSEWAHTREIIEAVKGYNVLTVGETGEFLELGGIITFIPGTEKPVFEINNIAAKLAKIQINSRVLRLAKRVIDEPAAETQHKP